MRMIPSLVTALAFTASIAALPGISLAKHGGIGPVVVTKTQIEAELAPCCGAPDPLEPGAEGEAERKTKSRNGVVGDDRFKAKVEIPVPSALGIVDLATALAADVRLLLSRSDSTLYAECMLVLTEIETELEDGVWETQAEYKVDVRRMLKRGVMVPKAVHGSCVDQTGTGTGLLHGVPDVRDGDLVLVSVDGTSILNGAFAVAD